MTGALLAFGMAFKRKTGQLDVLDSGVTIAHGDEDMHVVIPDVDGDMTFTFRFMKKKNEEPFVDFEILEERQLVVKLINFGLTDHAGTKQPLRVGTYNKRVLYLGIAGVSLGQDEPTRILYHTFYLGEAADG